MERRAHNSVIGSFWGLFRVQDNIRLKNIRLKRLKYMLIFPLAPVFANMQRALFPDAARLFGLDAMTVLGSAYCLGAGALFAFTSVKNMARVARFAAAFTAAAFLLWLALCPASLMAAAAFMLGLGGCAACASFAYAFALNNAERLLGAAAISLFFALNQLDFGLSFLSGAFDRFYLTALTLGACACLLFYRAEDFSAAQGGRRAKLNPALGLMLYFFVAHYFVEIFYTYLPGASAPEAILMNGLVGVLAVALAVAMQLAGKRSIWNMCNLFFLAEICTYVLHFTPEGSAFRNAARFLHGFEQLGYIAAYYLLGCVFKKHGDFRLFKLCLVTILPASMVSYVIPGLISAYAPARLPLAAALVSGFLFIVFVFLSPAYAKHLFYAPWSDDFYGADMAAHELPCARKRGKPGLSPRETEIVRLLLKGYSAKQIAAELKITVNTANFHIKNLYRKLGVTSRSELFARLNAQEFPAEE
ncbi:MAG: helix-turn-helix transcriptional regulator [Clostridiaceae bacterium]|nr:helix-turn-helix transcriptional regulator [Eubacteriales bacterium]